MIKTKSTKRALVSSVVALFLCFTMLLGTTYAWFTDSVTSSSNIIKSGTLDVEMYWAEGTEEPTNANWQDASQGSIFDYENWEPGYTSVRHIKIENKGTLALQYKIVIIADGEISDLTDVIDVYYEDPAMQISDATLLTEEIAIGNLTAVLASLDETANGVLDAGASDTITIALKMRESAGNNYQNKKIGTFSIQLLATQYAKETDSLGSDYDMNAEFPSLSAPVKAEFITNAFADANGNNIKTKVSNIVFGKPADYPEIVNNYTALDNSNGVSMYQVESNGEYTVYYLSNSPIALPADSTGLFRDMTGLTVFDGTNLDMSQVTSAKYLFRDSANITEIKGAENWDLSNVTSTRGFLYNCSKLKELDVSAWDVSNVEDAGWMFYNCSSVTELDVANWDTSSMNFAKSMFYNNQNLTELDVENWDMSDVTDTSYMFSYCTQVGDIDFSKWDVSNVQYFNNMFKHARAMTTLDLSTWDTSSATDMNHMFANCGQLRYLDISNFDTSKVTTMAWMFYEIEAETIYVGDKWSLASIANLDEGVYSHKIATAPLVGGQGTTCRQIMDLDSKCVAENGARINATARYMIADGGTENPGLLTYKAN